MKRKYSQAASAKRTLRDAYVDGLTEDEQAEELLAWYGEHVVPYESSADYHRDTEQLPF